MRLRDYAERVLRGATLADKLVEPGELDDTAPGPAARAERPARPRELAFTSGHLREGLPGRTALEQPRVRGELLHRFANHELLALEIMASTLLRFPDAPAAFRLGLARTMAEEQRHLRGYLDRMAALGVLPGAVPVNDFFWRACADLADPYDYVLRVPLTVEQANLDFTRTWRARFAEVGDQPTVALLDEVYRDEIGHVRAGLGLFRQWKDPAVSEWEAFERGLRMPLSPARARGPEVDREGRLAAGFDAAWIDRIERYARSRGRPPRVYLFNPGCEEEIAAPGNAPSAAARALAADLAPLLAFLAAREDVVVTPRLPSPAWQRGLLAAGFVLPELVDAPAALADRHLGALVPWGASPRVAAAYAPLRGADPLWSPARRRASDKTVALGWRRALLEALAEPWLAPPEGEVGTTVAEAVAAAARGWVLKAPLSTAGRDRRRGPLDAAGVAWAERVLAAHGALRAEPWRERVLDLSFHFDVDGARARFVGTCRFLTTPSGQFVGTTPGRWFDRLDPEVLRLLTGEGRDPRRLRRIGEALGAFLAPELAAAGVQGPVGVDAFVYRDETGALRLDPLVEVNPRWTMGRVSLALEARVHPQARATWRILPVRTLGAPPAVWAAQVQAAAPLEHDGGLLRRGVFFTTDPVGAEAAVSLLELG